MRHGTTSAYRRHRCRCDICRAFIARKNKEYQLRLLRGEPSQALVDSTPTIRRIRALQAIGWSLADIAGEVGYANRSTVATLLTLRAVRPETAQRIAAVYARMEGTPGPSELARNRARGLGFPPPLAWDCIDTDPKPHGDYPGALLTCVNGHRRDVYGVPRPDRNSYRCRACAAARESARAAA